MKQYKLCIILLAAGNSKRFQGNKMLSLIDGKPMYLHMLEKVKGIPACQKVIVTQYNEIIKDIKNDMCDEWIKVVKNEHSEWGISHSIQLGIEYCKSNSDSNDTYAYLFAVCDQPWLTKESIARLIETYSNSEKGIACLTYQGRTGNPVIFHETYVKELIDLKGDVGGKSIIKFHLDDVEYVQVMDPIELIDIDIPLSNETN